MNKYIRFAVMVVALGSLWVSCKPSTKQGEAVSPQDSTQKDTSTHTNDTLTTGAQGDSMSSATVGVQGAGVQSGRVNKKNNAYAGERDGQTMRNKNIMDRQTQVANISSVSTSSPNVIPTHKADTSSVSAMTERERLLDSKGITLDKLKYMAFLYVKVNNDNIKSIQEIYDSGQLDKATYERTKVSIEKNLRIIRLLNQVAQDKDKNDKKFTAIYLEQLIAIMKDGLVVSQEVLRYLQGIYDTKNISQQKYIASANNLKTNVNMMWDIIRELDF